jgi:hypothetical protein
MAGPVGRADIEVVVVDAIAGRSRESLAAGERSRMFRSMTGLAARPGTEVEPRWTISAARSPTTGAIRARNVS